MDDALLAKVRVAETTPGITRVVLDLTGSAAATTSTLSSPDRLIIELRMPAGNPLRTEALPTVAPVRWAVDRLPSPVTLKPAVVPLPPPPELKVTVTPEISKPASAPANPPATRPAPVDITLAGRPEMCIRDRCR